MARELVGCVLEVAAAGEKVAGRIVEVEAYLGEGDPASHAGRGRTPRSEIMFGPPGFAYVYLIYGMHHCLNFVTEAEGTAGAVLIRGVEPVEGREVMAQRRGLAARSRDRDICAGPGRLCQALGIDLEWNGWPLVAGLPGGEPSGEKSIRIYSGEGPPGGPAATRRIGIRQAVASPYRFLDPHSKCLSS